MSALVEVRRAIAERRRVVFRGANLWRADLRDADLRGADLRDADLWRADLRDADLRGADLRGAILWDANLRGANLWRADLRDADLRGADLRDADLWRADLRDADLRGADLRGADLRGAIWHGLIVTGLPSGVAILRPLPTGWELEIGCWVGHAVQELRDLVTGDEEWPEAEGAEKDRRRPGLLALADMCDAHIASHPQVVPDLAKRWGGKHRKGIAQSPSGGSAHPATTTGPGAWKCTV